MFSAESKMQQFVVHQQHSRRPPGIRYDTNYERFSQPDEIAGLYFLNSGTTTNAQKYLELLQDKLGIHVHVHSCSIFMHDGAPCHKAKKGVNEHLQKIKITILEWPGNSPNFNPEESGCRQTGSQFHCDHYLGCLDHWDFSRILPKSHSQHASS